MPWIVTSSSSCTVRLLSRSPIIDSRLHITGCGLLLRPSPHTRGNKHAIAVAIATAKRLCRWKECLNCPGGPSTQPSTQPPRLALLVSFCSSPSLPPLPPLSSSLSLSLTGAPSTPSPLPSCCICICIALLAAARMHIARVRPPPLSSHPLPQCPPDKLLCSALSSHVCYLCLFRDG